ncbi:MAG: SRPBCC family protein [Thermodesulfobacteriota bacterium]|nr:SRPBCC family protein [Thermodesulfobacteriota bacterium]
MINSFRLLIVFIIVIPLILHTGDLSAKLTNRKEAVEYFDFTEILPDLVKGKVVITKEIESKEAKANAIAHILIEGSRNEIFDVLLDFSAWHRFVPYVKKASPVKKEGNSVWVTFKNKIFFFSFTYTLRCDIDSENYTIVWSLDESYPHRIKDTTGYCRIIKVNEKKTITTYSTSVSVGKLIPKFLEDYIANKSLPKLMKSLRKEVMSRKKE